MHFDIRHHSDHWRATLSCDTQFNHHLIAAFEQAAAQPRAQSHFFSGRFENIYIDPDRLIDLPPLLAALQRAATEILQRPVSETLSEYWFNRMEPGHITGLHSHDNDDEVLSVVYYLKVPRNSGNLVLHTPKKMVIRPRAGDAIFFDPALPHEVTKNNSDETRLSLALNFGPVGKSTI